MSKILMALCDEDEKYVERMLDYFEKMDNCPFELLGFSNFERLRLFCVERGAPIDVLLLAESCYQLGADMVCNLLLILREDLGVEVVKGKGIDKYQPARMIYKEIIGICLEEDLELQGEDNLQRKTRVIGFYSPVKRAMQTSFALALGKDLSAKQKVLYISFDPYADRSGLSCREGGRDILDLVYYLKEREDKFRYRLSQIEQRAENMLYIPPAFAGQNLVYVSPIEWMNLMERLVNVGEYDVLLLDLSDSLQGLFEILRFCERVFTVTIPEGPWKRKVEQYQLLLQLHDFDDVIQKSVLKYAPQVLWVSEEDTYLTKQEWKQFIEKVKKEDLEMKGYE